MSEKINVLNIEIDKLTAKEAMRKSMEYLNSEPVSVIEMVTADGLMQMNEIPELKEEVQDFELVLAGDKAILEAAGILDNRYLQETTERTYLKLFLKYLHKNHRRVYLMAETQEDGEKFSEWLAERYSGMQIVGISERSAQEDMDDMIVNAVNGGEADCVLSILSVPRQEEFIKKNKNRLNTRIWLGIGKTLSPFVVGKSRRNKITQYVIRHFFKKEIEKQRKIQ